MNFWDHKIYFIKGLIGDKSIERDKNESLVDYGIRIERNLNQEEKQHQYLNKFPDLTSDESETSLREKALERAWLNRDFEINKYWQRAAYFWGFIVLLVGAYLTLKNTKPGEGLLHQKPEFELYVVLLGIIFSLAWYLVNLGSKRWQENWEGHIDELENEITGPLYKSLYKTGTFYSVSKINNILSFSVILVWLGFLISFFKDTEYSLIGSIQDFAPEIAIPLIISSGICIALIKTGKNSFGKKHGYFFERPSR